MSATGDFRVVVQDAKQGAATMLAILVLLCALCVGGVVALDNAWRFVLAVPAFLLAAVVVLVIVQLVRGAGLLVHIDARGLVATKNRKSEQILPAERFQRFELIDPGNGTAVTLRLRYRNDDSYEPPRLLRNMEQSPGCLLLAVVQNEEGDGSLSLEELWRLRRFVEQTGVGTWSERTRPS